MALHHGTIENAIAAGVITLAQAVKNQLLAEKGCPAITPVPACSKEDFLRIVKTVTPCSSVKLNFENSISAPPRTVCSKSSKSVCTGKVVSVTDKVRHALAETRGV